MQAASLLILPPSTDVPPEHCAGGYGHYNRRRSYIGDYDADSDSDSNKGGDGNNENDNSDSGLERGNGNGTDIVNDHDSGDNNTVTNTNANARNNKKDEDGATARKTMNKHFELSLVPTTSPYQG